MSSTAYHMDTIFALSSGALPAAVAIVRLSGPGVASALRRLTGSVPEPRRAGLRMVRDDAGAVIDEAIVLYFPGPGSFTGEDCAELHLHGGRAVVQSLLRVLGSVDGFRSAEPGEFTRRAFENGRMDLTEVEGLADLIAAETEMQRLQALEQSTGGLSEIYGRWRKVLIRSRAMIEADFDFSDEEDVPGSVAETIWEPLSLLAAEIEAHLAGAHAGEIIRDGYRIVILGAPNAGKSSLLNTLARRDIAIVSGEQGTTRDVLEVYLDIAGFPVVLSDTAGLREAAGDVEREGMRRALLAAKNADLILALEALDCPIAIDMTGLDPEKVLRVGSKADLVAKRPDSYVCCISVRTRDGMEALLAEIEERVGAAAGRRSGALPNRQRHREYLLGCVSHLQAAIDGNGVPLEVRAEELRRAADMLGRLTGHVDVEDLLDVIFKEFCVGK